MRADNEVKKNALLLPDSPGVYRFYDEKGALLYIGKAKNLKHRVSSYFTLKKDVNFKLTTLVKKIRKIEHIIVENESEALLLENSLIKQYQPRYNILLKDDKTYPWICIKNERFPRVFLTRNLRKDNSEYYGPYTSAHMVRTLLDLIYQLYNLRTCNYVLSTENINSNKFKVCLEYHLGNCKGPCEKLQDEANYNESIKQIRELLKGNLNNIILYLKNLMGELSINYKFEEAEIIKNKILLLEKFKSKSTVINPKFKNVDVFSIIDDKNVAFVNFIKVIEGAIIQSHTVELIKKLDEKPDELLLFAITELRKRFNSTAKEIIIPFELNNSNDQLEYTVPKIGDRKKLLELSFKNARFYKLEKEKQRSTLKEKLEEENILIKIKEDLNLKEIPIHIECFDNSNIQGNFPVAACVVFKNGKPKKSEYRHFNIKTVEGINDFASMEEIVTRRYKRLINEKLTLPQLVIIDGGKGQLSAAYKSLKNLNLQSKIRLIGIAKRLEEIYFPGDSVPLYLNKNSASLKLIQQIRNEAHRFGITFHRNKRSSAVNSLELERLNGIGKKTMKILIDTFKTPGNISNASLEDLERLINKKRAKIVWQKYHEG